MVVAAAALMVAACVYGTFTGDQRRSEGH